MSLLNIKGKNIAIPRYLKPCPMLKKRANGEVWKRKFYAVFDLSLQEKWKKEFIKSGFAFGILKLGGFLGELTQPC